MKILFLVLWLLFLGMQKLLAAQAAQDKKVGNALNAFIIAPMSVLGYIIHPILIPLIKNKELLSVVLMIIIGIFAFANIKLARLLRGL